MSDRIVAESLTTFEIAPDGSSFSLHVRDADGRPGALVLPADCLRQLVMTMPRIAAQALRAQYRDDTLRLAYPLKGWKLEASTGGGVILTMTADDGFDVSFVMDETDKRALTGDLTESDAAWASRPVYN